MIHDIVTSILFGSANILQMNDVQLQFKSLHGDAVPSTLCVPPPHLARDPRRCTAQRVQRQLLRSLRFGSSFEKKAVPGLKRGGDLDGFL